MANNLLNEFGLAERDMIAINGILSRYPEVEKVCIFGSRAMGNFNAGSDIDLAIINSGLEDIIIRKLKTDFSDSNLPYRVDLVYMPEISHPDFRDHIKRVGIIFYEKQN